MSLDRLIERCKNHELKAQEELYRLFSAKLFSVSLKYSRNSHEAEDNLQDSFITILNKIGQYNFKGSFEGWMKRIMVNTAIDFIRKEKSSPEELSAEGMLEIPDEGMEMEFFELEEKTITIQNVLDAMAKLTPVYRAVFNMYVFDNLTHQEIAMHLGISVGASKSNLAKARRNVKSVLLGVVNEKVSK